MKSTQGKPSSVLLRILTNPYVSLASRLILGGVLLYAGVSKVFDPGALAASIRSYELPLPEGFVTLWAHALPLLEILLGLYLLIGLFSVVLIQGAVRGLEVDCGCFGSTTTTTGEASSLWVDVMRDLGLLALALQLVYAAPGKFSLDARLHRRKA